MWPRLSQRTDRLAGDIVQHPTLAGFHARLMDPVAKHVVVVEHHLAAERVGDGPLVALDVEFDARWILAVCTHCRRWSEGTAERVEVRDRRRIRVHRGLGRAFASAAACSGRAELRCLRCDDGSVRKYQVGE